MKKMKINKILIAQGAPSNIAPYDELKEKYADKPVQVILMDPAYYSTLNGEKALKHLIKTIREANAQ